LNERSHFDYSRKLFSERDREIVVWDGDDHRATCTPQDAFRCFMGNELDSLVVGRCVLHKAEQDIRLKQDYSSAFELD